MRHARAPTLDQLEPLLEQLRALPGPKEKGRGVFYWKSKAFLHFHEDSAGLFADIRDATGKDFDRYKVDEPAGARSLIEAARARLGIA